MPPVAAAVAGFVTSLAVDIGVSAGVAAFVGNGILALGGAMGLGAAVGAWAVVGGIAQAAGLFGHPQLGAAGTTHNPIEFKADPQAGIPYVIGRTGTAGNIVYIDHSGGEGGSVIPGDPDLPPNRFIHFFTVYGGGGPYHALEAFKADDVTVTFNSDGQTSTSPFAGNMWLRYQLGAQPETAMTQAPEVASASFGAGALPSWDSAHKLSGKFATWWTLQADQDAYPNGQPKPLLVLQGAYLWDPRQDSTYPGGSGPCRLNDPSTWVYSEWPQLHALKWALGIYENGKRIMGLGAPLSAIDVAAFVEGANIAEANGWKIGGTVYSTDNKYAVLVAMLQAGGAIPVPLGAQISCVTQQPRVSIGTVTALDMAAPPSIARTQDRKTRINQVIPTYRDENFSWQLVEADPVRVDAYVTADGELRSKPSTYALVQDVDQAAQLARYEIEDAREGAPIVLPMYTHTLGYKPGDCITADDSELALTGQKLLILKRELDSATGMITFTCRTETDSKHSAALGETGTPPPPNDQSTSRGKYDGETPPPGLQWGGHGTLVFTENLDAHGAAAPGKIRIKGKRINTAAGRLGVTLKEIDTPFKTGGLKGVFWLVIGAQDAADRFPGWATDTQGLFFVRYFGAGRYKAYDSAGTAYNYTPSGKDATLLRVVRRNGASAGIEQVAALFDYSRGLAPDYAPTLAAPAAEEITAQGQVKQGKDGTTRAFLKVASNAVRSDADLFVRWRPAAGDYPGAIFAADFQQGVYQLDPDQTDPGSQWHDAPRPLPGLEPSGRFGGFEGQPELASIDVATQWRERDDAGLVSPWLVIPNVAITEDTTAPGPVTGASVVLKRGVPRVKWTNPTDADFRRTNWRRGTTTVFAAATPIKTPGSAEHFDDPEAAAETPVYYFATTVDRTGNEDLGAYVMVGPVTPTALPGADIAAGAVDFDLHVSGGNKPAKNAGKIIVGSETTNSAPSTYRNLAITDGLERKENKQASSIGVTSTETYGKLITFVPGPNTTDGRITQDFKSDDGTTWRRIGQPADGGWNSWYLVRDGANTASLADINSTEGTKLAGIAAGATVGADYGSNLANIPTRLAGDANSLLKLENVNGELSRVAASALSAFRVVYATNATGVDLADPSQLGHNRKLLGVTTASAGSGAAVQVKVLGALTVTGAGFTGGLPVYCAADGSLTQTPPTGTAWTRVIGFAFSSTLLWVQLGPEVMGPNYAVSPMFGGVNYHANTILAARNTPNYQLAPLRQRALDDLIWKLDEAGILGCCDLLYVMAGGVNNGSGSDNTTRTNLVNPGTYDVAGGGATWAQDMGWTTGSMNTGAAPSALSKFSLNDASISVFSLGDSSSALELMSNATGGPWTNINPRNVSNNFVGQLNSNSTDVTLAASSSSIGHFGINRSSSSTIDGWINGVKVGSGVSSFSSAVPTANITIAQALSARPLAFAHVGRGLTNAQWAKLYAYVRTYLLALPGMTASI